MFPFWEAVITPVIDAVDPRRIVEIGALKGDTTIGLLDTLGSNVELHVIDPVPQFDPAAHERRFEGRYRFHRDLSLNVLPGLQRVDLALVDGDHNWYTVRNQLELLERSALDADAPGPVFVLHDVGWPYGRRDGYYAVDNVPTEYRQPSAQRGLARTNPGLLDVGGMNAHVWNADHEGGPRNGVLTALDDFVADQPRPFTVVVLDIYTGLAVAADDRRLATQPGLRRLLHKLDSTEGRERVRQTCEASVKRAIASGELTL